ncbi:MAG: gliding motility-associated C-terminal domain-containing protein [Bacteroidales bacterium]|nr:gliding motility-associated C-terminal domain-containing protein [Bacteroidales bacterium]
MWTVSNGACPSVSDEVTIEVLDVEVPSGFSPNGDNINDCFGVRGAENAESSELIIFNRYNKVVYKTNTVDTQKYWYPCLWDGRNSSGKELPSDTYYYQLTLNGDKVYKGYVILKR